MGRCQRDVYLVGGTEDRVELAGFGEPTLASMSTGQYGAEIVDYIDPHDGAIDGTVIASKSRRSADFADVEVPAQWMTLLLSLLLIYGATQL